MKILFIINDGSSRFMEYQCTGILNAPNRRAVEIELTPEQVEKIGIQIIGVDGGRDLMETIESISLLNQSKSENEEFFTELLKPKK